MPWRCAVASQAVYCSRRSGEHETPRRKAVVSTSSQVADEHDTLRDLVTALQGLASRAALARCPQFAQAIAESLAAV